MGLCPLAPVGRTRDTAPWLRPSPQKKAARFARSYGGLRPPLPPPLTHAARRRQRINAPPCTGGIDRTAAHLTAGPPCWCGAHRCGLLARMARAGAREPYRPPPYPAAMGPKGPIAFAVCGPSGPGLRPSADPAHFFAHKAYSIFAAIRPQKPSALGRPARRFGHVRQPPA